MAVLHVLQRIIIKRSSVTLKHAHFMVKLFIFGPRWYYPIVDWPCPTTLPVPTRTFRLYRFFMPILTCRPVTTPIIPRDAPVIILGIDGSISSTRTTMHLLPCCGVPVMPLSVVMDPRQHNGPVLASWHCKKNEWIKMVPRFKTNLTPSRLSNLGHCWHLLCSLYLYQHQSFEAHY